GGAQAGALLLHVRAPLLLDEDHPGRARLRGRARAGRAGGAGGGHGRQGGRVPRAGRGGLPRRIARNRAWSRPLPLAPRPGKALLAPCRGTTSTAACASVPIAVPGVLAGDGRAALPRLPRWRAAPARFPTGS